MYTIFREKKVKVTMKTKKLLRWGGVHAWLRSSNSSSIIYISIFFFFFKVSKYDKKTLDRLYIARRFFFQNNEKALNESLIFAGSLIIVSINKKN